MLVEPFIFLVIIIILYCEGVFEVPIVIGKPLLDPGHALVDMGKEEMKFKVNKEEATFNIFRSIKPSGELQSVSAITYRQERLSEVQI